MNEQDPETAMPQQVGRKPKLGHHFRCTECGYDLYGIEGFPRRNNFFNQTDP